MTELNGAGQRVTFAVSVVAALFLSTAVWADGQGENADPGMTDGGLIAVP
jgi:hypothetical protein